MHVDDSAGWGDWALGFRGNVSRVDGLTHLGGKTAPCAGKVLPAAPRNEELRNTWRICGGKFLRIAHLLERLRRILDADERLGTVA